MRGKGILRPPMTSSPPVDNSAASGDVVVVGSINVDFVVRAPSLPAPGETVTGGSFERHFGGKGANQAVAAARLGARVTLVGAVGDDELGDASLADLRGEGVDVSRVARLGGTTTGVALIVVESLPFSGWAAGGSLIFGGVVVLATLAFSVARLRMTPGSTLDKGRSAG